MNLGGLYQEFPFKCLCMKKTPLRDAFFKLSELEVSVMGGIRMLREPQSDIRISHR